MNVHIQSVGAECSQYINNVWRKKMVCKLTIEIGRDKYCYGNSDNC